MNRQTVRCGNESKSKSFHPSAPRVGCSLLTQRQRPLSRWRFWLFIQQVGNIGPSAHLQPLGNPFQAHGRLLPKPPRHHHFPPLLHQKRKLFAARLAVVGNSLLPQEPIHSQPGATLAVTGSAGQAQCKGLTPASRPRQAPDTAKTVPGLIHFLLSQVLSWRCLGLSLAAGCATACPPRPAPRKGSQALRNQRMPSTRWARRRPKRGLGSRQG